MNRILHITHIASRLGRKKLFSLMGRTNERLQPLEKYGIKKGYHHAATAAQFDDTSNTDEWQKEVYEMALDCLKEENYRTVTDMGCGSAYKLINMLGEYETTGIEVQPTYDWLCKKYPGKKWLLFNQTDPSQLYADLIICADVIEHVPDPDELMRFLQAVRCSQLLISTPERDAVAGKNDYGPPENTSHYREWNASEFRNYVSKWFNITDQRIFSGKSATQILLCKQY